MASLLPVTITPQELRTSITFTQTMFEFLPTYLSDALIGLALFSALTYIIPFVLAAFVWKEQNLKVTLYRRVATV
jgi:hypothetical protein